MFNQLQKNTWDKKILVLTLVIIAIVAVGGGFYFWQKRPLELIKPVYVKPGYSQTYRLVPEKISQSAGIVISLPEGVDKSAAKKNIKFSPELEGAWLTSAKEREVIFKPKEKLKLNRYHSVQLTVRQSEETVIEADFLAVEDPEIIAIFPREGSEAPEGSEITIVFNRPMVALTTLEVLEAKDVPVEIVPATEGRFKWLTTKNLQFIPKERLRRSSHYEVKIKSGLMSMDNLTVKEDERKFTTRKLRYLSLTKGEIAYNQPISIYFNQPVDLEMTKKEISLRNIIIRKEIPFTAEYPRESSQELDKEGLGKEKYKDKKTWSFRIPSIADLMAKIGIPFEAKELSSQDQEGEKALDVTVVRPLRAQDQEGEKDIDRSIIQIYNKEDRFGREKSWDFENRYSLIINMAYPIEGDIILNESQVINISTAGIIKDITAESERTSYAAPDFFDPQGKLWVSFYEEIDLEKSKIASPKLKEIGYGEKCKDETQQLSYDIECDKVPDKTKMSITFQPEEVGLGERLEVKFEKLVNIEGLNITEEPIVKNIISFPEFKILKTVPQNNSFRASLTELVFCSNSPILAPAKEDYEKHFKANLDYEFNYWGRPWKISETSPYYKCNKGEFQTTISYGLMPQADYSLEFQLEDVFGQKIVHSLKFTTEAMPEQHLLFYHFQRPYNVTSPLKTKLTYAVKNMNYVNLEICRLDPLDFLYELEQKPGYYEPPSAIVKCQEIIRDQIQLPERYWIKNYFRVDLKDYFKEPIGHYILTFYHPNYRGRYWDSASKASKQVPVYERTYLTVTNLAVGEKRIQLEYPTDDSREIQLKYPSDDSIEQIWANQLSQLHNLYWVTNISDLEPVSDARVDLYRTANAKNFSLILSGSYSTNEQGIASTSVVYGLAGAVISKGGDSTIIPSRESRLDYASSAFAAQKIYLYTDKPIYQPEQEVFIKGIQRLGYDGSYEIYRAQKINLQVYNSKDDEILNKDLEINEFGTFNTKLVLEKKAPLGMYRVCAGSFNCVYFDIQEYVPAPFEVQLKSDKEEYISKDAVNLEVEANYYFGVPLEGGTVFYTISSQDYYFDRYSDGYFNFGTGWYYWPPYIYGDKFILRGKTSLDVQGKAQISQSLDFEKLFKDKEERQSKIIVVDVTVRNPQGRSVSAQKSFIVHAGEFYLGLKTAQSFAAKNEKFNIKVKSVDVQGKETKVTGGILGLYKIDWIQSKRLGPDGGYNYQWEKKRDLVKQYNFDTDKAGNFTQELKIAEEGSYEIEVTVTDQRGNAVWSIYNLYVYGEAAVSIKPTKDTVLEIEAEKIDLNVGEEASIIIKSPYPKAKALIAVERGRIFDYQLKEIRGNLYNYKFKIQEEYIPNVYVSVLLHSSEPEVKFGKVEFKINTTRKELDIEVKSNKTHYLPGEEVVLDIAVKDWNKNPVSAELSIAVVDLSVLALKGNPKKNPLIFFYSGFPLTVATFSNIKDVMEEFEVPTKGGGGGVEDLARKRRGIFKETAFWQAVVRTDQDGKARLNFTLPDNLTTWQTEAVGLTQDTKLGVDYQEFMARKELMVAPLKPRFVVPGDIFYIGAKIFNQTEEKQILALRFDSSTLVLKEDTPEKKVMIQPNETDTIYFQVEAPRQFETGEHRFTVSAKGRELEDTVEQSIALTSNETYEVAATANYTSDNISQEYVFLPDNVVKDKGELSIKSSATLAVFLSDALNYLFGYPYGCSEQIASRLNAIAIVQRGLSVPNISEKFKLKKIIQGGKEYSVQEIVELGLAELYNNQQGDGGFSYWRGGQSDFYLTLHIVDTFYNLSLAGFEINQNSLSGAADFLYNKLVLSQDFAEDKNALILASHTLLRMPKFANTFLKQKIVSLVQDDLFLQEQISNSALAYLAIVVSQGFNENLKNKVFEVLDNRINIDVRGAFLETGKNIIWRYYETPIKNTALYLKALSARRTESPILAQVIRWLLQSRAKDGAWGSTNNTITVIDGFTDFLQWKRETESDFTLELFINAQAEDSFDFSPETILEQFSKEVPLQDLKFNKNNTIKLLKTEHNNLPNNLYYDLSLKYYLPVDQIPPRDEGFSVTREFYRLDDKENKEPLTEARVGDVLRGHLQITVPNSRNFVLVEDYIPSGMELVNLELATEEKSLRLQERELEGRELSPDFKEIYDDRVFLFKENLEPGVYEFDYYARALIKGKFLHLPVLVSEMYFPENFGRTDGRYFEIK